jgi:phosphoribosylaminoimidazole carboxylase PurE protein
MKKKKLVIKDKLTKLEDQIIPISSPEGSVVTMTDRPPVAIIMGSQSDWETMKNAADTLEALEITYDARIISAHRTPDRLVNFAKGARAEGFKVIIAGAGGAAHLPGMTASMTPLPVFGVPVQSKAMSGQDSLLSIVQMPGGIPVGTLAIGKAGAINAALLAAAVLALSDEDIADRLDEWRERQSAASPNTRWTTYDMTTIGIIGGGQLGRMLAMAAARLNFRTIILEPQVDCPAAQVANTRSSPPMTTRQRSPSWRPACDVVTYEFENVPVSAAEALARSVPVYPPPKALEAAQDRLVEKRFINECGIPTAKFHTVDSQADLDAALKDFGGQGVLKTRRLGYDGKGQKVFRSSADSADGAYAALGGVPLILESFVAFEREISIIAARATDGTVACFDPAENVHRNGILHTSTVPGLHHPTRRRMRPQGRRTDPLHARLCRRHRHRVLRARRWQPDRQRDGAARPQFRPLDGSGLRHLAVRAAYPRRGRPAARQCRPPLRLRDAEPDRRRYPGPSGLAEAPRYARSSLRKDGIETRPQDGSRHHTATTRRGNRGFSLTKPASATGKTPSRG